MTDIYLQHTGTGYQAYASETGRDRRPIGPVWPTPREASRYAQTLRDVPATRPLAESPAGNEDSAVAGSARPAIGSPEPVGSDRQVSPLPSAADPGDGGPLLSLGLVP